MDKIFIILSMYINSLQYNASNRLIILKGFDKNHSHTDFSVKS